MSWKEAKRDSLACAATDFLVTSIFELSTSFPGLEREKINYVGAKER